ncbi:MAG: hypothetical protein RR204_03605 [Raoultibacter sp.]
MKQNFSLSKNLNHLRELPSIQFSAVSAVSLFIMILLPLVIVTLIPAEWYASFGEAGLYLLAFLMVIVFVAASFATAVVWSRICTNMLKEKPDVKKELIKANNYLGFCLWTLTGILGLISLSSGLIPSGHEIQQFEVWVFLTTSTFFSYSLAVEYVLRFKLQPDQ